MKHIKLRKHIRKEITSILSESKLNETLDGEVFNMLDKILIHMKAEDLVEELIRALSTSDAKFYLSSIMKDWGIPSSQEDYDALSENRYEDVEHMFAGEKGPESRYDKVVRILMSHGQSEEEAKRITRELSQLKEDEEPTAAQLKKKDSISSISNKLQKLVQDMKDKAKEWKSSEGEEKEKIKTELKKMTKEKKELEKSI